MMGGRDRNHSALDNISRFGCWNVRTMNGREQELEEVSTGGVRCERSEGEREWSTNDW